MGYSTEEVILHIFLIILNVQLYLTVGWPVCSVPPSSAMSENVDDSSFIRSSDKYGWLRQYLACLTMSFLCLSKGFASSWSSPMIPLLQAAGSPVGKMTDSEINTLQALSQYAGVVAMIIVVYTLVKFGTKICGYSQAAMSIVGWILLTSAASKVILYAGRFLIATSVMGADILASFYLSEIAHDSKRGTIISLTVFSGNFGSLVAYFLGTLNNYRMFNVIGLIPVSVFVFCFYWFPETPAQHAFRGRKEAAINSYAWFQNVTAEDAGQYVEKLLDDRRPNLNPAIALKEKSNRKALLVLSFMAAYIQLCGVAVVGAYTSKIFEIADCSMTPNQSALMVAVIVFIASLVGAVLIDWAGRRFLVIIAVITMTISQYIIAAYFILKENKFAYIKSYQWSMYVGLGGFLGANAIGISSVAPAIGAEMVPAGVKGILWMIAGVANLILNSAVLFLYQFITDNTFYYVNFLQEAIFCTVGIVIAWYIIPETKGKSLDEITAELNGGDSDTMYCIDREAGQNVNRGENLANRFNRATIS